MDNDDSSVQVEITSLEDAINRCNAIEGRRPVALVHAGARVDSKQQIVLCRDASLMAEVYALMIFSHQEVCSLADFSQPQREAYLRWRPAR